MRRLEKESRGRVRHRADMAMSELESVEEASVSADACQEERAAWRLQGCRFPVYLFFLEDRFRLRNQYPLNRFPANFLLLIVTDTDGRSAVKKRPVFDGKACSYIRLAETDPSTGSPKQWEVTRAGSQSFLLKISDDTIDYCIECSHEY